ncbi:hypothetical protein [Faecalibacterium prausnitzii]|uniref:hypothetical protein n=1 Tax=Faecalibacterium prausnitzii TaxID=853 RepID=UPI0015F30388|nr:hypothetical protein [Faecalibacterium prausnitzii]
MNELIDTGKYSCSTFIPLERYEQLLHKELTPTENDILITSRGTLGKCYIVQSDDEFYFQDGMISWLSNFSPKVSSIYISYLFATVYKGNIIKNLIMDCQSYTKYRPNETTGGIFVSWRRKEELPTGA